ncbi:MAG: Uma2 family endonuclease [Candidatus Competibacterales bacterium]
MNPASPEIRPHATYRDVLDAPPHRVAELVAGRLHLQPRPAMGHALATSRLGIRIGGPFDAGIDGPGGWWIIDEPELHLADDVVVPDIAGWRRERMPAYPDTAATALVPDWACEVLSPSTRQFDLVEKRAVYGREGLGHLWFVDPLARTLEAFVLRHGAWTLVAALKDDDPVRVPPFDAVEFPLSALWPD